MRTTRLREREDATAASSVSGRGQRLFGFEYLVVYY